MFGSHRLQPAGMGIYSEVSTSSTHDLPHRYHLWFNYSRDGGMDLFLVTLLLRAGFRMYGKVCLSFTDDLLHPLPTIWGDIKMKTQHKVAVNVSSL